MGHRLKSEASTTELRKPRTALITVKDNMTSMEVNPMKPPTLPLAMRMVNSPNLMRKLNRKIPYNPPNRQTAIKNHNSEANIRKTVTIGEIRDQMQMGYECISVFLTRQTPKRTEDAANREKIPLE